jgi:ribosomal protein S18 acetylase RimI-like enzyme
MKIRPATPADAGALARLVNQAGEGLPLVVWTGLAAPGVDPWEVGRDRVRGTEAGISHKNAWVAERDGAVAGCLISYRQPAEFEPLPPDMPAMFRPLAELEAMAPDTGYVYVLSTFPEVQGQGIGARMLGFAERYMGPAGMSLIVSDANHGARRLYERAGYRARASVPMVKEGWDNLGETWVLMVKPPSGVGSGA